MQITLKLDGMTIKVKTDAKIIKEVLKNQKINTESVLVKRNGKLVPSEEKISDGDEIEAISIISSG